MLRGAEAGGGGKASVWGADRRVQGRGGRLPGIWEDMGEARRGAENGAVEVAVQRRARADESTMAVRSPTHPNGVWRFRDEAHPSTPKPKGVERCDGGSVCDGSGRSVGAGGRGWNWGSIGTMEGKEASEGSRESGEKMGAYANGGTACWGAPQGREHTRRR